MVEAHDDIGGVMVLSLYGVVRLSRLSSLSVFSVFLAIFAIFARPAQLFLDLGRKVSSIV